MLAARAGSIATLTLLLENGADLHAREKVMEQTALMFAAAANRAGAIRFLLARGARADATSKVVNLAALTGSIGCARWRAGRRRAGPRTGRPRRCGWARSPLHL
jgi:ankyrin repeat protein